MSLLPISLEEGEPLQPMAILSPLQGLICFGLITQGCARIASLALGYFLFALSGLRFLSFIQEQLPLGDAVGVAEVRRHRQFLRRARDGEQLQAGLVREAIGLALVHVLRGPNKVFPRVHATARAGHHVIEAAFVRVQRHTGSGCRRARGCSSR